MNEEITEAPVRIQSRSGAKAWLRQWLQALQHCNERLAKYLADGDWENAQAEATTRDHLLRESTHVLRRFTTTEPEDLNQDDMQRMKQVLSEVKETSREFIETLKHRRQELGQKIKTVQQGRSALNLYRTPKPEAPPRFLDRKG